MEKTTQVAVVGATGVVGREILGLLAEAGHPSEHVTALGPEGAAGQEVEYGDDTLEVEGVQAGAFRGMGVVLLATPAEVSQALAAEARAAGAWVVDLSDAFGEDPAVPVLLPPLTAKPAAASRLVRCPSASTTALALLFRPLLGWGVERVRVTALVGASWAGDRGIQELEQQTAALLSGREPEPGHFPHRLAFNLIPQVGPFEGDRTREERGWSRDLPRLLEGLRASVEGTAVQAPTFFGELLSIELLLGREVQPEQVREALRGAAGVKLLDAPGEKVYPMPSLVTADPAVHVGRVRTTQVKGELLLLAAIDNARRGSAATAVEIALTI